MRILGCDWDNINLGKIAAHDLEQEDVEALLLEDEAQSVFLPNPRYPSRWIALGYIPDGRFVLASFEYNRELFWVRVVTAYEDETDASFRLYEKAQSARHRGRP